MDSASWIFEIRSSLTKSKIHKINRQIISVAVLHYTTTGRIPSVIIMFIIKHANELPSAAGRDLFSSGDFSWEM